jgi:hypothetical protein
MFPQMRDPVSKLAPLTINHITRNLEYTHNKQLTNCVTIQRWEHSYDNIITEILVTLVRPTISEATKQNYIYVLKERQTGITVYLKIANNELL